MKATGLGGCCQLKLAFQPAAAYRHLEIAPACWGRMKSKFDGYFCRFFRLYPAGPVARTCQKLPNARIAARQCGSMLLSGIVRNACSNWALDRFQKKPGRPQRLRGTRVDPSAITT